MIIETDALAPEAAAIRPALLPMFPASIVRGGLELQCVKTAMALREIGVPAALLDYHDPDASFDVLHLFGSTHLYADICLHAGNRWPIVLSAVCGGKPFSLFRPLIWGAVSAISRRARLSTEYDNKRRVYRAAAAVLCLNRQEAEYAVRTFGADPARVRIVPNGVDDAVFDANPELFEARYGAREFALFTGSFIRRKNPLLLARALRSLGLPGVFIGAPTAAEKEYGRACVEAIQGTPNLLWIPTLAHDDPLLASAYAAARVFCLPSYDETQSLSALEAMAAGAPVILADRPYAYQSPFEDSLRCPAGDERALAECLKRVFADPERFARRLPDSYRWKEVARAIRSVYEEITA